MEKAIKVIKAFINALMTLIIIFGIIFVLLFIIGIKPFVVLSGSMEPTIKKGSLSFVNENYEYDKIKNNDIIAYEALSGDKVTHRVISITEEGMETKGDKNNLSDGISTTEENYIGKNIFSIPKAGYLVKNIQTSRGKIILSTIIIMVLISGFFISDKTGKRERVKGRRVRIEKNI